MGKREDRFSIATPFPPLGPSSLARGANDDPVKNPRRSLALGDYSGGNDPKICSLGRSAL